MRAHRVSAAVWVVAGGLVMFGMALAVATEMDTFPGGPNALAVSVAASAEALRPMRWPAEHLETLGGYLTYHNVILFNLMLAVYGAVQGSRAVRGGEERHALEEVLAAGVSRAAVVRGRAAGFALTVLVISFGLGLGTAAGLAAEGEPDLAGSLVTMGTTGLLAMVGYGLGLLVSQVTSSARAAAGVSGGVLAVLYVATNMGEQLGPLEGVTVLSPFRYANASRALVPGYDLDVRATVVLVVMVVGLLGLAGVAFARRDYAAPLWGRPSTAAAATRAVPARVPMPRSVWAATLRRSRFGLIAWASGAAFATLLMASLERGVMDVWSAFDFVGALTGAGGDVSAETAYWSFAGEIVSPVIAAYVIVQASAWVADLADGRVEMLLAGPVSWSRLVAGRLAALVTGVVVITVAALCALVLGAAAVGSSLDAAAVGRLAVGLVMVGAALGGIAALAVGWARRGAAVTVLAVAVGGSYLLAYLVPMFDWPDWLNRLSVFWALGHPYLEWPGPSRLVTLLVLAVPGALLAAAVAERTPKVA